MTDNNQTPHIVVDAAAQGVEVPRQHVQDGKIILNVSYHATQSLSLSNEAVSFNARFGGVTHHVMVPIHAVMGVYARETGQGMIFGDEDGPTPPVTPPTSPPDTPTTPSGESNVESIKSAKRAKFTVVK